ncbi:MAG: hypothetical protein M1830_000347 [Pleopsidium flavum]|nr:MAG: hypothetical protein M1830_000347 [Pleopsidium flavum]
MSVIKERFGELDQFDQDVNIAKTMATSYQDYDRGATQSKAHCTLYGSQTILTSSDDPHAVIRTCSQEFLNILISDLAAVRDEYKLHYKEMSKPVAEMGLLKILEECKRLTVAPELFAKETSADEFFGTISRLSAEIVDTIAIWKRRERRQKAHLKILMKRYQNRSRYHYLKGRKPWQQFLSRDAPGSGTGLCAPSPRLSLQIVPWAGVRLLSNWSKECRTIIKAIEDTHDGAPITLPGTHIADGHIGMGLDGNVTRVRQFFARPNPFNTTVRRYPEGLEGTTPLERLGQAIDGYDHEVAQAPRVTGRVLPMIMIQKAISGRVGQLGGIDLGGSM